MPDSLFKILFEYHKKLGLLPNCHYINQNSYSGVLFYPKHAKSSFKSFFNTNNIESYSIGSFTTTVSVNVISQMTGVSPDKIVVVSVLYLSFSHAIIYSLQTIQSVYHRII